MRIAAEQILARRFSCGPVSIELAGEAGWVERLAGELQMFDVPFEGPQIGLRMEIQTAMPPPPPPPAVQGTYLRCNRFKADREGDTYVMAAQAAWCVFDAAGRSAQVFARDRDEDTADDVEQFLIFALVWGWRAAGWVHLHAAALERGGRCALVCAESHGGKSTFTAACARRGWGVLGDDKVLIRPGAPAVAYGLSSSMNLDPEVARWFPEAAGIEAIAPYSRWTPKRKVRIESLWPGATRRRATPAILLKLQRTTEGPPVTLVPLAPQDMLQALARQTVIPCDRQAARLIVPVILRVAGQMRGWLLTLSPRAYDHPKYLGVMDELLA